MNSLSMANLNKTPEAALAYQYTSPDDDQLYKEYKPVVRELIPLPKPVVYMIMAALVVVAVAYAIVGHLIKDLAHDVIDFVLGPNEDDMEKDSDLRSIGTGHLPAVLSLSHTNAFHVWDQDDVVIPLSPEESPPTSPMLLTAIPYIPSFFPMSSTNNSPALDHSPGSTHTKPKGDVGGFYDGIITTCQQ